MSDDERLYAAVLRGEAEALTEIVGRYHAPLFRFLVRQTGDSALADDLVQETFTRLLTYRGPSPARFKPWVYAIARNLAHDYFKSAYHRREQATDFDDDRTEADESLDDAFAAGLVDRQAVTSALQRLSPDHREVLILRFYDDLNIEEIAQITGAPVGTVKSRLFHALKYLKADLAGLEVQYGRAS